MKKHFVTGLILLLPLALTIVIVVFIFNLFTQPFAGIINSIMVHYGLFEHGFGFLTGEQIRMLISQFFIMFMLFFALVILGYLARGVFLYYFLRYSDYIFKSFPIISPIYITTKDIINTLFTPSEKTFKQVVMIHYPTEKSHCIGFISRENIPGLPEDKVFVFVPTTPNPTSGFLILADKKNLTYLNIKIDEALKCIISCGLVTPTFETIDELTLKREADKLKKSSGDSENYVI